MKKGSEDEQRDQFFAEMAEDFARLRADADASAEYDAELEAWDITLLDGLDEWPFVERSGRARLYDEDSKTSSAG